jgi:hypothetical protein
MPRLEAEGRSGVLFLLSKQPMNQLVAKASVLRAASMPQTISVSAQLPN